MRTEDVYKTEKNNRPRIKMVLVLIFGLIGVGLAWMVYLYVSVRPWLNFQQYVPSYIVDGRSITDDQRLTLYTDNQFVWFAPKSVQVQIGLTGSNWSSWILEGKEQALLPVCDANLNCSEKTTPGGQKYRIIQSDSWTQHVVFAKGGTQIEVKLYGKEIPSVSDEEWSRMVDSFQPKNFEKLRINHMTPGP